MAHFGVDHLRSRICSGALGSVPMFEEEMSSLAGLPSRKCLAMNIPSMPDVYDLAYRFAAALGIGLLIGAERERRKGEGPSRSPAGIRTFMIASLSGAVSLALGGVPLLAITFLGVAGLCAVGYMRTEEQDPGLTTETALLLTVLLGGFALKEPVTASALAVTVAIALMARTRIHHFIRAVLSEEELTDALIFAAAALVVLPLVPDRYVGPFSAINPRTIWKIVILIMSISAGGHIAVRLLGPRFGLPLAGLASGFVSSVATIASMGARARKDPVVSRPAVAGAVLSTVATVIQLAVVLAATSWPAFSVLKISLVGAGLAAIIYGALFTFRNIRQPSLRVLNLTHGTFSLGSGAAGRPGARTLVAESPATSQQDTKLCEVAGRSALGSLRDGQLCTDLRDPPRLIKR